MEDLDPYTAFSRGQDKGRSASVLNKSTHVVQRQRVSVAFPPTVVTVENALHHRRRHQLVYSLLRGVGRVRLVELVALAVPLAAPQQDAVRLG